LIPGSTSDGTESASVLAKFLESYAVFFGKPNNIHKVVKVVLQTLSLGCLVLIHISSETGCSDKRTSKSVDPGWELPCVPKERVNFGSWPHLQEFGQDDTEGTRAPCGQSPSRLDTVVHLA
jgi:hypothetical protein